jgi:hypothetical protein
VSSSFWGSVCDQWWHGFSSTMLFSPLFSLLSPQNLWWPCKVSELSSNLWRFPLRFLFFWFLIFGLDYFVKKIVIFSNLILILLNFVLLSLLWSWFFISISPYNQNTFVFLIWILIVIVLLFLGPVVKLFFLFNFILQSKIKFILYFNFDPHSFNCYFCL